jgi:LmbE family N-acetylglucosaminyl deacetylase
VSVAILSPHLDDAVFSCWHVLASPQKVAVINVFTAVPESAKEPPEWDRMTGADDAGERMRLRLEEDRAALALAGRHAQNLDFLESQYRDEPPNLVEPIRESVADAQRVFAPAAIGGHSDHELVRDAALALAGEGREVLFYADLPYATEFGWPAWMSGEEPDPFRDVDVFWARFVPDGYAPRPVELSEEQQRTKVAAMRTYRTQFSMLEAGPLRRLTHPELVRFESVWIRSGRSYTGPTAGL